MGSTNDVNDSDDNDNENDVKRIKIVGGGNLGKDPNGSTYTTAYSSSPVLEFKHKNHSLGINASSVAACVGYHEFKSIPELMLQHVYQGRDGQRLLEHDAQLLGLRLASPKEDEAELLELAETCGSTKVLDAVKCALKVKNGDPEEQKKIQSVEDANVLKQTISELEKVVLESKQEQRLTQQQLRVLKEGTRQAIDTGCGHFWEEEALDRYQDQCGWEVRERNAECRLWHFEKTESETYKEDGNNNNNNNIKSNGSSSNDSTTPSIRPLGPARARYRVHHKVCSTVNGDSHNSNRRYDSRGVKRKHLSSHDSQICETALRDFSIPASTDSSSTKSVINRDGDEKDDDMMIIEVSSADGAGNTAVDAIYIDDDADTDADDNHSRQSHSRQRDYRVQPQNRTCRPFVTIKGMVDGIRDELGPTTWTPREGATNENNDDDDDLSCGSFSLSRVVVECKHRMRVLLPNGPRFSECIQAVVYCFMYEANDADIVQVLRSKNPRANAKIKSMGNKPCHHSGPLLTSFFKKSSPNDGLTDANDRVKHENGDKVVEETNEINRTSTTKDSDVNENTNIAVVASKSREDNVKKNTIVNDVSIKIAVDRVSLDDPKFGHRANWKAVILPKLRRWVDAVYRIRQSDDKRYRLLTALSMIAATDTDTKNGEQVQQQNRKDHVRAAWELVFDECDFLRDGMSGERYRIETQ